MASAKLFNRVKVATATTGTGTVTLGAASSNAHCTFAEAGVANNDVVTYELEEGTDFEIGRGTYTSAGTTLSRDTVLLSKIGGTAGTTKMTLAGAATVRIVGAKEDIDVNDFTAETAPAVADLLWLYDASASAKRKMRLDNALKVINSLTEDTSPDRAADYVATYDASATAAKKVLLQNLGPVATLASGTFSHTGSLLFGFDSFTAFRHFKIVLSGVVPDTDGVALQAQFSTDGGTTYIATGYNYAIRETDSDAGTTTVTSSGSATRLRLTGLTIGSATNEGYSGEITVHNPAGTAVWPRISHSGYYISNVATPSGVFAAGGGSNETAQDLTDILIDFSSGFLETGRYDIYGIL